MTGLNLVLIFLALTILYTFQLYFNRSFLLKLATITFFTIAATGIYFSFETYKGWPVVEKIDRGILASVLIIEPEENTPGAIYAWVVQDPKDQTWLMNLLTYKFNGRYAPKAFFIPYSDQAQQKFQKALEAMAEGQVVEFTGEQDLKAKGSASGEEGQGEGGEGDASNGNGGESGEGTGMGDDEQYNVPSFRIRAPKGQGKG